MNKVTTELTAGSKEMEDENFMVLVKLAQAEPNLKLEAVMEGLKFLLLRVRRQYGWGLEEDVERQMERIGVFTALQLWHGSDRRQFAALAAWQVRRELWNEVRRERDFKKHRAYESLDEHGELVQEQEMVNDFYQLDERQTQLLAVRVLDVWVARYGAVDAAVFLAAARRLMGGCYFPRFCDMDAAVREEQRRRKRMAEGIAGVQRADAGDREANRRRVQVLIENLSKRRL